MLTQRFRVLLIGIKRNAQSTCAVFESIVIVRNELSALKVVMSSLHSTENKHKFRELTEPMMMGEILIYQQN